MVQIGVTVAVIAGDTILLTLREDFEVWCMPGGGVEAGESLADAARREVREETGLEVELTRMVGCYSRIGWFPLHTVLFTTRVVGGTLSPQPGEVLDARFFPLDALPDHLLVGHLHRIHDVISGLTGLVKTEYVPPSDAAGLTRADIYAARDRSSLSRREYYLSSVPPLTPENILLEISGVREKSL